MTFYVTNQNYVVLCLFVIGVVIGVIYDIFKIKREIFGKNVIFYYLDDLLFSFIYTTIFVFAIFLTNYGYVRWYEIVSAFIGFIIYKSTISNIFVKITTEAIRFVLKILKVIIGIIFKPIIVILSFVLSLFKKIYLLILGKIEKEKTKINSKKRLKRELILSRKGFYKR